MKVYTYTRTYTKEECDILDLKEVIFREIKKAYSEENNCRYMKVLGDGNPSDLPQTNLCGKGILVGPDFLVRKEFGLVDSFGSDLAFDYFDEEGQISSGEDLASTQVTLKDQEAVGICDFPLHPEIYAYIQQAKRRIKGEPQLEVQTESVKA